MRKRYNKESDMYLYKCPYIYRAIRLRIGLYAGFINRLLHATHDPHIYSNTNIYCYLVFTYTKR